MQQEIQEKTTNVAADTAAVCLKRHKAQSKILRYNTVCTNQITLDREALEDVKTFTHLGSISSEHGGSHADVKVQIVKHLHMKNI
ncbi:unnamed protein product [Schistosoma margrebowiei]|uniref:Uncharacterized protein n=1 Tax=Schistosoma margrebowiei TaxID=48269 RepID=A0A183MTA0_9TREM|nr:unnamed protein product [Schistosoma margrebowiei]